MNCNNFVQRCTGLLCEFLRVCVCGWFKEKGEGVAVGRGAHKLRGRGGGGGGVGETCDIWNRNRKLELQFMLIACCTFSVPLNSVRFSWVRFISQRIPFSWLGYRFRIIWHNLFGGHKHKVNTCHLFPPPIPHKMFVIRWGPPLRTKKGHP